MEYNQNLSIPCQKTEVLYKGMNYADETRMGEIPDNCNKKTLIV